MVSQEESQETSRLRKPTPVAQDWSKKSVAILAMHFAPVLHSTPVAKLATWRRVMETDDGRRISCCGNRRHCSSILHPQLTLMLMLTRFLRTFLLILVLIIVVGSFLFISPRSRTYLDPFTGHLSEVGGFEPPLSRAA